MKERAGLADWRGDFDLGSSGSGFSQLAEPASAQPTRPLSREPSEDRKEDSAWEDSFDTPEDPLEADRNPSESLGDIEFFLSMASRYPLLSAGRERELAFRLWQARRRLAQALDLIRQPKRGKNSRVGPRNGHPSRPISPAMRQRLIAIEQYCEKILTVLETGQYDKGPDRSLPIPRGSRRRRGLPGSPLPPVRRDEVARVAPILRRELETVRAAREELVQHNLRLVIWVAKTYRARGLDLMDLIQEGSMGLLRAVDRYDPALGTRFSTFATHWIRQGIGRALAEKARTVRIPLNRLPEAREAMQVQSRLTEILHRTPTVDEVAAAMNVSSDKLSELFPALSPLESIDAPLPFGDLSRAESIADEEAPSPLEQAMQAETSNWVRWGLKTMSEREQVILSMRFGIGYTSEHTFEEIGRRLGLSRERIRQVEKGARKELQSILETAPRNGK